MTLPSWTDDCLGALSGLMYLGRASRFSPERAAVLRAEELEKALRNARGAEKGRLLTLLGRGVEAGALLRKSPAYLWALTGDLDLLDRAVKAEPDNPTWRTWRAVGRAKRHPRAADADARAAGRAPLPLLVRAWLAWQGKRPAEAEPLASEALEVDASIEWAWRLRARARMALGRRDEALEDCLKALELNEYLHVFDILLPEPLSRLPAKEALRKLEGRGEWWALALRADYKRSPEINDHAGALEDMKRCVAEREDGWSLAYLTRCQVNAGDRDGAAASIQRAARLWPKSGWIAAWKGEHLRRSGEPEKALAALDQARRLDPDYEFIYAWRGAALRELGRAKEALADLGKAIALKPPYVEQSHFERMRALRQLKRPAEALRDLEAARALNAKYSWETEPARLPAALRELSRVKGPAARRWRGELLLSLKRFDQAERALAGAREAETLTLRARARLELGKLKEALADLDRARKLAPRHAAAAAWRGRARVMAGSVKSGLRDLEQACALDRGAVWMLAWRAEAELRLGLNDRAVASADAALALHPRYEEARRIKARALGPDEAELLSRDGRHEEAAAELSRRLAERPDDEDLLRRRAEAWRCCGRYAEMLRDRDALLRVKRGPSTLCARGDARRHLWDFEGALEDAKEALELSPSNAGAWALKAEAERGLGRLLEAEASARKAIAADSRWSWARVVLGKVLRQAGRLEEAERELAGDEPYALAWRADVLRAAGKLEQALADAEKAVAARPGIAWFRALRGEIKRDLGRDAQAWEDVQDAVRLDGRCSCDYDFLGAETPEVAADPKRAWVFAWRGAIARREGRLANARRDLDRAVALDPGCFWARAWRGELALHEGRAEEALEDLEPHPTFVPALLWSGQAQLRLGRALPALERYRKALELAPSDPWAHIGVGASLEALGRGDEAARAFGRARELAPALFEKL